MLGRGQAGRRAQRLDERTVSAQECPRCCAAFFQRPLRELMRRRSGFTADEARLAAIWTVWDESLTGFWRPQLFASLHHLDSKSASFHLLHTLTPSSLSLPAPPAVGDVVISAPTFHRRAARLFDRWEVSCPLTSGVRQALLTARSRRRRRRTRLLSATSSMCWLWRGTRTRRTRIARVALSRFVRGLLFGSRNALITACSTDAPPRLRVPEYPDAARQAEGPVRRLRVEG